MKKVFYNLAFLGLGFGLVSLIPDLDGNMFMPLWASISLIAVSGFAEYKLR